jgi:uncharacterized coiled-coil protein SlyX
MSDAEARLISLEIALAHAEAALSDLSEMVALQAVDIEGLRRDHRRLLLRLQRLEETSAADPMEDRGFIP